MSSDPKPGDLGTLLALIAEALESPEQRKKLEADPQTVLRDAGLDIGEEVEITVHQNSAKELHIVLPAPSGELGEAPPHVHLINMWPV